MLNNDLFQKFCRERNIAESTQRSYESALKHYLKFNNQNLKDILSEAIADEEKIIPLKDRRIKKTLNKLPKPLIKKQMHTKHDAHILQQNQNILHPFRHRNTTAARNQIP